jgi:hypothetical protein
MTNHKRLSVFAHYEGIADRLNERDRLVALEKTNLSYKLKSFFSALFG